MKTAIFLSIREKAKRLPGKVLREIRGKTVCEHLIDRLKLARKPDLLVMTTSTHPDDTVLCEMASRSGIPFFRGSEEDKLDRYLRAAEKFGIDFMVIVDGDDLFCSEEHIDLTIEANRRTQYDYISQQGLPLGAACFGIRQQALKTVCELKQERDTEVWGGYFTESGLFQVHMIQVEDPILHRPDIRMTLDYEEDLRFFEAVIDGLFHGAEIPPFRQVMTYLGDHPEIVALNQSVQEKYERNLHRARPVRMRQNA
jgi:spore coat polysaccharide biosynthesis protein SpsF